MPWPRDVIARGFHFTRELGPTSVAFSPCMCFFFRALDSCPWQAWESVQHHRLYSNLLQYE